MQAEKKSNEVKKRSIKKSDMLKKQDEAPKERDMSKYKLPLFERMILSPRSDAELETIAHDLIVWAQEDDAIVFDGFVEVSGVATQRLYEWSKRNEKLAEAMAIAKRMIGARREKRGLEGRYNGGIVMGMMWQYNEEYRSWKKEMATKNAEGGMGDINVIVEQMPSSPLVKDRKE